jgi:hypothetical protein
LQSASGRFRLRLLSGSEGASEQRTAQDGGHSILNLPLKLRKFAKIELNYAELASGNSPLISRTTRATSS